MTRRVTLPSLDEAVTANRIKQPWRASKADLAAAVGCTIPDVIAKDLDVLFVGINPGRYSGAVGHHFAGPGNGFWPAMFKSGFTPRLFSAFEGPLLLDLRLGLTNLVARCTATADELTKDELVEGGRTLEKKARRYAPRFVAFVGLTSYRAAFARPKAQVGLQPELIGPSKIWLLPNPSGLNTHHPPAVMAKLFSELRRAMD
jgi:TDG/mug DNA glycosylase family protein